MVETGAGGDLVRAQIAQAQKQVLHAIGVARMVIRIEHLQLGLGFVEGKGIEQFPKVGVAEQVLELRLVDRKRLGPAFRERRIALIDVVRDV